MRGPGLRAALVGLLGLSRPGARPRVATLVRMAPDRDAILVALERVIDPELKRPVTDLDMVRDVVVAEDGAVAVTIALTVAGCPLRASFQDQVARHVGAVPGVTGVTLHFDVMTPEEKEALATRLRGGRPAKEIRLDPTTRVVAVVSGKGGVGKSTLSANLAAALVERGERVGILDADVYGYSIPHVLGISQRPVVVDSMIIPPVRGDLHVMSIGLFAEDNSPIMWRGPMLHKALEQFLSDVHWGALDTLVVDMPPGTGDVAISIGQLLPRAEALVVTTPQPAAQQVAVRSAVMAQKTGMRIVGVVENMSWLVGTGQELFGAGGGEALAAQIDAPLVAQIPLDPALREAADEGRPVLEAAPDSEASVAIRGLAERVQARRQGGIRKALTVL
jgi:ATP-binding protein involved in chromosome partitioning